MNIMLTIVPGRLTRRKPVPLSLILGERLVQTVIDPLHPFQREATDDATVLYLRDEIGCGVALRWSETETDRIILTAAEWSTAAELKEMYAAALRIRDFWKGRIRLWNTAVSPATLMKGLADMQSLAQRRMQEVIQHAIDQDKSMMLFAAKWPVTFSVEDAHTFLAAPESIPRWLHEKQAPEARFCYPSYRTEPGYTVGRMSLWDGQRTLLPMSNHALMGQVAVEQHLAPPHDQMLGVLYTGGGKTELASLPYDLLLERLPPEKVRVHDARSLLVEPLTEEEICALADIPVQSPENML